MTSEPPVRPIALAASVFGLAGTRMIEDNESHFDLHVVKDFFDVETCRRLTTELQHSRFMPAPSYGKGDAPLVDERTRRTLQALPSEETVAMVRGRLEEYAATLEQRFGLPLSGFESPEFLRYRRGDFFVAHQDGNTGMVKLKSDDWRRVSISIFLNSESEIAGDHTYSGGSLVFSNWRRNRTFRLRGEAGTLVAFRSETTHEVRPVIRGERYAIVTWFGSEPPAVAGGPGSSIG
jgi:SM-20-related protein